MIKVACIGLMAVFLALKLKSIHSEYALLTGIAACIVIFGFSVAKLDVIFSGIDTIRQYLTVNGAYIGIILKLSVLPISVNFQRISVRMPDTAALHPR